MITIRGSIITIRDKYEATNHKENTPMQYMEIFSSVKIESFIGKISILLIFLLKTLILGTRKNRLVEAVLKSIHNLSFGAKIRKISVPSIPQFSYIKLVFKGVYTLHGYVFLMSRYKTTQNCCSASEYYFGMVMT